MAQVHASAPGRICLFGEHCDYLGLPVVAAAIDLRMTVQGEARSEGGWVIEKPDIGERDAFALSAEDLAYTHGGAADYLRGAVNALRRDGVSLPQNAHLTLRGEVPVQAGTSSSSALQVAWLAALLTLAGDGRATDRGAIGRLAYASEVTEFNGSGGMMDQITCALGGLVRIDPAADGKVTLLPADLGAFVLGHSLEPKDTQAILSRLKAEARAGAELVRQALADFDWATTSLLDVESLSLRDRAKALLGALRNRDLCAQGTALLSETDIDHERLGALLSEHHAVLRDALGISTAKIEGMLAAAMAAGALGGKINGSGGGGCMFAYAPNAAEDVAEAIRSAGGEAWVVHVAEGVTVHAS